MTGKGPTAKKVVQKGDGSRVHARIAIFVQPPFGRLLNLTDGTKFISDKPAVFKSNGGAIV